jgi:hypothetical protein
MAGLDFNHAMIYTRDVGRSLQFYADLLGFKKIETFEWQGSPVYARLKSGIGHGKKRWWWAGPVAALVMVPVIAKKGADAPAV